MLRHNRLQADRACLLLIDVQEKLLPAIRNHEKLVTSTCKLLEGLRVFDVPVVATEQYPKGLGGTDARLIERLSVQHAPVLEKPTFSACGVDCIRETLRQLERDQVLVAGIEAHVCVQQTVLDLCTMDYTVFVCADAIGSRAALDYAHALERMRQEGALVTSVESVLFELCERCDTESFRRMLQVIKAYPPVELC